MKIELFSRRNLFGIKKWYFRIRAGNGEVIAHSEAYSRRIDAMGTAQAIRQDVGTAEVVELS